MILLGALVVIAVVVGFLVHRKEKKMKVSYYRDDNTHFYQTMGKPGLPPVPPSRTLHLGRHAEMPTAQINMNEYSGRTDTNIIPAISADATWYEER